MAELDSGGSMFSGGDDGVLQFEAVNDSGVDKTKDSRTTAETRITSIFARLGSIVIVGYENDTQVEKQITIDEAILRTRALVDMVKAPWKYPSDLKETRRILNMFVNAINDAQSQLAAAGFGSGVQIG